MKDDLLEYLIVTDTIDEFLGKEEPDIKTIDLEDYIDDEEEKEDEEDD